MGLITVDDCKNFRNIEDTNDQHDEEMQRIIVAVQSYLETECGRKFEAAEVTEFYSGEEWHRQIIVARPPINSIVNIWDDVARLYPTPLPTTHYVVYDKEAGIVKLDFGICFMDGLHNIKVTYNGGYSAAGIPVPPDLKEVAIEMAWAAREKGVQNLIGVRSRGLADGNLQYLNLDWPMNLLPIIDKYSIRRRAY